MTPKTGQYYYTLRGNRFYIYRCDNDSDSGYSGSPVNGEKSYTDRNHARKRVYELNGWKFNDRT